MNISEDLKNQAISLGLCQEWTDEWGTPDKDELCDKYVRGIDFAIEHNYPSLEEMKANFDGVMQKHGIYVSENIDLVNPPLVIANGSCTGHACYDKFSVGRMYVRHDSVVTVYAGGSAKVFISLYDSAKLKVLCEDTAKVYVYKYGGVVECEGNVYVREREGRG